MHQPQGRRQAIAFASKENSTMQTFNFTHFCEKEEVEIKNFVKLRVKLAYKKRLDYPYSTFK